MTELGTELLGAVERHAPLGYGLVFLASLLESLVLVGGFFPGTTLVVFAGALAARGEFHLGALVAAAVAGAILGDGVSFHLGRRGTGWFREGNRWLRPDRLEAGRRFFRKHGGASIFLGRFVGPIRMAVPFVAGVSGMESRRFYHWNVSSAVVWGTAHVLIGYFLGRGWRKFAAWSEHGGVALVAALVAAVLVWHGSRVFAARHRRRNASAPAPPPPPPPPDAGADG